MPEAIEIQAYDVGELEEDVKARVLDKYRDFNTFAEFWFEHIKDWFIEEKLPEAGFDVGKDNLYFSGFCCQGDGASFSARVDLERFILDNKLGKRYRALLYALRSGEVQDYVRIHRDTWCNSYYHSNTMGVYQQSDFDMDPDAPRFEQRQEKLEYQLDEIQDDVLERARELANEYYDMLEEEYNYQTSDEQIIDSLQINEVLFTKDGRTFPV